MTYSIRAFSDPHYDYYRLTKDFGLLKAGAVFYHDPDDNMYGSAASGCLKLCWRPDGNCYGNICAGTVILHCSFADTDCFEKIDNSVDNLLNGLSQGYYGVDVHSDGTWTIQKFGSKPW